MIKIIFFDFSRTVAKGSGFGAGPALLNKKDEYDKLYQDYQSHKLNENDYVKEVVKLWKGVKESDLSYIYSEIELNSNVKTTIKKLKNMKLKLTLVSNIPINLGELYKTDLGFDYISGTECEIKDGIFTGKVIKINADKSFVINKICNKLEINLKDCVAVGDAIGDIKMFKAVGQENSIAYNANEEVKSYAKYHISDFKEIIKIIQKAK